MSSLDDDVVGCSANLVQKTLEEEWRSVRRFVHCKIEKEFCRTCRMILV